MTTAPTSGAAIQRYKIGYHADEWGQRSSTPSGIPDASGSWVRYEDHIAALAAGQATAAPAHPAAQQGVAYAALPEKYYLAGGEVPTWNAKQMHVFADATHMLRASHGQAPAWAGEAAEHYRNAIASACEGWTMPDGLRKHLETALWSPPTPQPTQPQAGAAPLDEARRLFDAGWKAAALFCDREDVVADGIIGFGACPQFEAAFSAAHGIKGGQHGTE